MKSCPPLTELLSLCSLLAVLSLQVCAVPSCAGGHRQEPEELQPDPIYHPQVIAQAVADGISLPLPSSLAGRPRDASNFDDRLCFGDQWEAGLPSNKVAGSVFSPQYAGAAGRSIADSAYAIFGFGELSFYNGPPMVKLRWKPSLDQPQNLYIALANRQLDRWDWYKVPASGNVSLPDMAPYEDQFSQAMLAVVSLDNGDFDLDYVLWGDSTGISLSYTTDLNPDPLLNLAPLTVNFDAGASVSYGGKISSFDFDWEDDGSFDLTGVADGKASHSFAKGKQRVAIRATDDLGQSATSFCNFVAIDPANLDPIASFTLSPNNGDGPLLVSCDAGSSSDPDGSVVEFRWDFDGDGIDDASSSNPLVQHTFARAGDNFVRLTVRDNFFAESSQVKKVTLLKGWHEAVIDSAADARTPVALCTSGSPGRASVAYIDVYQHELRFKHANNDQGSSWGSLRIPASAEFGLVGQVTMVTSVGSGVPIICYGDFENSYVLSFGRLFTQNSVRC
ncbi:PKD domain-containing protein [bacterium]|nr:PKD domain-containing protein [bacterium]